MKITIRDIIRMYYHPLPNIAPERWYDHEAIEAEIHDLRYQIAREVNNEYAKYYFEKINKSTSVMGFRQWLNQQEKK